ncbi:hypothetical protein [Thermococcus sp. JCM 11816]|uniref:hypothetical protein n=1 Tax=Thermococcus sp. (strain JCM 11816 / KS-1) TaxID=1295125 RepID=UPI0006D12A65
MTNDGDRRNLITTSREIRKVRRQTISAIFNQLQGFSAHEEFSDLVQEAKEKYGITRIGVFDVDMIIWDFKNAMPIALLEVKNRHQLQESDATPSSMSLNTPSSRTSGTTSASPPSSTWSRRG